MKTDLPSPSSLGKSTQKMSSEDRRAAIIHAVRRVFAEHGFKGTTTRALAEAAGVSEALLFKHFPNKEALYSAMQLSCFDQKDQERVQRMMELEPSASTLVLMVHFLVNRLISPCQTLDDDQTNQQHLVLRSLAENGDFARHITEHKMAGFIEKVKQCLTTAMESGDAWEGPVRFDLAGWFTHHLALMTMLHLRPDVPVVNYGVSREVLVEQIVWFALRGMGLKEEVIKRYYNSKGLALFAE
ncbi:TetR/AcrR family transcriptional regulator [Schlesneria sp. T3-172]|uniref:TetR/AcrR family transcriptional regulator n=1 Tax=Schlesneria sphaerica TaxID=3373610 RepID=UPI0037C81D48